jgi:uncharacterized repeat protein (TIGR01451 family)
LVAVCALLADGCSTIKVPAIDPTGKCLFLPEGNYTTLEGPSGPCAPTPAFTVPATPPPCPPEMPPMVAQPFAAAGPNCAGPAAVVPAAPPPAACALPGQGTHQGRLVLTPAVVMAPVGSEVVLVTGYCDERNQLSPKQTVEWMVAPDSVGQIMATDDDRDCFKFARSRPAEKRSGSYAITRTLANPEVLTRGTPQPNDDVPLQRGQTWASVTSPTEGTSHVTVLAPEAANWDQRRQTATIYWVDVEWTLPGQSIVQAGQPTVLTTTLRRRSGKPLADWIVRYEITGSGTAFAPNNQTAVDITTDAGGAARVNLVPAQKSTTAQVVVKIIRPSKADDEAPVMIVGQGWTSVTWSAPDPKVTLTGPATAGVGSTVTYRADISNAGDIVAHRVVASTSIPPNMTFLQSNPPAKVTGNQLVWELNDLPPNSARTIQILCRPERNATVRFPIKIESADQLQGRPMSAETYVETRIFSSGLALKMNGPASAPVGQRVTFEVELSNAGAEPLTNIIIRDRLPVGLEHPTERSNLIEKALREPLAPGASLRIAVELIVRQPGRLCHVMEAVADGGHTASVSACVTGTAAPAPSPAELQAAMQIEIRGPDQPRVNDFAIYTIQITNSSSLPLTRLRIVAAYEPSLYPADATPGFDLPSLSRGELVWNVDALPAGERLTREIRYKCLRASPAAWCRVSVGAVEGAQAQQQKNLQVLPAERPPLGGLPGSPSAGAGAAGAPPDQVIGELKVQVADRKNPIAVNETTTYIIVIENARNVSDKNVRLTISLPPGMEFVKLSGPVGARGKSPDGRTIELAEVAELRAGEALKPFYVEARGLQIGKHTLRVRVDSFRSAQPVEATKDTTVNISG